ncbi:hypothetical protein KJ980_07695 [Patescibacteria group bacterium]|nr:hypothetical protein [Patescibacteria group bacterium]MBU4016761.1 hypothetical protein [Patescibacteria group bacterium]MBU4099502.1 hypothetical protein [Patescibacteria group bacterium]
MVTNTTKRILDYIRINKQAKVVDLVRDISITNSAVHRQLNKLLERGEIMKVGKPPVVFYILKEKGEVITTSVPSEVREFINKNYIYVSPAGEFLTGIEGFTKWVLSIKQGKYLLPLAIEYVRVRKEADTHIALDGWIDATQAKVQDVFNDGVLHKLLYKDFYSLEKFGKTQLGQMVLYAKISQNVRIIDKIVDQIWPVINKILQIYNIDTIAYIPPSIKRKVQLMTELKKRLKIRLPEVVLVKVYTGEVTVSQKSLTKFQERVENAKRTIFVDINKSALLPNNVLIIDDAVGSGATIHETAKQIQQLLKPKGHIIGFAVVGSMKGFEVIREI